MVQLHLVSTRGNRGSRYFPHSGYLALSSLKVDGVVRLTLDEDAKLLQVRDVSVALRCYEARVGRSGIIASNILVESVTTLWSKAADRDFEPLGAMEWPFRLVLPSKVEGSSAMSLPEYRVFWRVEAIVNHAPLFGLGSRMYKSFDLRLVRYDNPPHPLLPVPQHPPLVTAPDRPQISYTMNAPTDALGPTDLVPVELDLEILDSGIRIQAAQVTIERRISFPEFDSMALSNMSVDSLSLPPSPVSANNDSSDTLFRSNSTTSATGSGSMHTSSASSTTLASDSPLITRKSLSSNTSLPAAKTVVAQIVTTNVILTPLAEHEGSYKKVVALALPANKSAAHWATGATIHTRLVSIRFFVRVQLYVTLASGSQESVELEPREIYLISTNHSDRTVASDKVETLSTLNGRSKSKSPSSMRSAHRSRRGAGTDENSESERHSTSAHPPISGTGRISRIRRPHTASGVRDGPTSSNAAAHPARHSTQGPTYRNSFSPGSSSGSSESESSSSQSCSTPVLVQPQPLSPRTINTPTPSTPFSAFQMPVLPQLTILNSEEIVRDWEEELERIAMQSSLKSAAMGRFGRHQGPPLPSRPPTVADRRPRMTVDTGGPLAIRAVVPAS